MSQLDLARLNAPKIEPDVEYEKILGELQAEFQRRMPSVNLTAAEPVQKLLEVYAWREKVIRERVNAAGKKIWLPYSGDEFLDFLGEFLGAPRFMREEDDPYRERIRNARDLKSTAGAKGTYLAHARTFPFVNAVEVVGDPEGNTVTVYPLKAATLLRDDKGKLTGIADGLLDEGNELAQVRAHLASEEVRPLTTFVETRNPVRRDFQIHCKIKTFLNDPSIPAIETLREAIAGWVVESHTPGRFVSVSSLYATIHRNAVLSCEILSPREDFQAEPHEAPFCPLSDVTVEVETVSRRLV